MEDSKILAFLFGVLVMGILLGVVLTIFLPPIQLTQETADDICVQLTGNESAVAQKNSYKTLTCEIPSFDATQNIIIKSNSERE